MGFEFTICIKRRQEFTWKYKTVVPDRLNKAAREIVESEGSLTDNMLRKRDALQAILREDSDMWKAPKLYLLKQIYKERGKYLPG